MKQMQSPQNPALQRDSTPRVAGLHAATLPDQKVAQGQGFLPCCLLTYPQSTIGFRDPQPLTAEDERTLAAHRDRLGEMIGRLVPVDGARSRVLCQERPAAAPTKLGVGGL